MSRKIQILEAAARVIDQDGINQLTLDAVAAAAGVSKGGLLYHYRSKNELVIALNEHIIALFQDAVNDYVTAGASFHEAYVQATADSLNWHQPSASIRSGLLAAMTADADVLALWRAEYNRVYEQLAQETYPTHLTQLVTTVCDGLWFAHLLALPEVAPRDHAPVLTFVLETLQAEEA